MRRTRLRWLAGGIVLTLFVAACGSDRGDDNGGGPAGGGGTTETTAAGGDGEAATFGDLEWPCRPGDGGSASDTGVTEDTILIGIGDDRGFATSPGLNKEMTDAVEAMVAKCNELGGINGRQIETRFFDAAILNVLQAMTDACAANLFMLVGQGFALDSNQEETRQGCGLPSIPTYTVSAAFAHAPLQYNGVPNPADYTPAGIAAHLAQLFPEEIKATATLAANFSATQETRDKVLQAYPDFGFEFVGDKFEYNVQGESDWTPFVRELQDAGAQLVYFSGSCLPNYQLFRQATQVNNYDAIFQTDANFYEAKCAEANTDGAMDNTYLRMAFIPFEERDANKATDDFLTVLEDASVQPSLLGAQGASSFLLWATAADACGADLTRQCVLDNIANTNEWSAGGLHAPTDPGGNLPPKCNVTLKLEGTKYVRVLPEERGTFECDDSWRVKVDTPAVQAAQLDENRVSRLFTP